jgi:hypothetical protein
VAAASGVFGTPVVALGPSADAARVASPPGQRGKNVRENCIVDVDPA